jgi:hypothetical protein
MPAQHINQIFCLFLNELHLVFLKLINETNNYVTHIGYCYNPRISTAYLK